MAHYPVNHRFRGLYRVIAAAAGLYLLAYGITGVITTAGNDVFGLGGHWALGLRTNPAQSWLMLLAGALIAGCALIGGNLHHRINMMAAWGLIVVAVFSMTVMRTEVNILNFSMVNVVVVLLIGLTVLCAALYGKVATDPEDIEASQPGRR
jgi:hypothetical protein